MTDTSAYTLLNLLIIFALLFGTPQTVHADTIEYSSTTAQYIILATAVHYAINGQELLNTLTCESKLNADTIGDRGTSYGVAQIHLPAHKDVTKAEALDPMWSIDWAAHQFSIGNADIWTCHRLLYPRRDTS